MTFFNVFILLDLSPLPFLTLNNCPFFYKIIHMVASLYFSDT